jgi:hypothetical protein
MDPHYTDDVAAFASAASTFQLIDNALPVATTSHIRSDIITTMGLDITAGDSIGDAIASMVQSDPGSATQVRVQVVDAAKGMIIVELTGTDRDGNRNGGQPGTIPITIPVKNGVALSVSANPPIDNQYKPPFK